MHIVDSHSQSIAKLETQLRQLAIAIGKREEGKLLSNPIQNPKGQQFVQLKAIMVLRSGKEVDNKVSEKEHDKKERLKTLESGLESEKKNDPSPSPVVFDSSVIYKPMVPYPQPLEVPFPSRKDKQRDDILETFKQVKVNLPLLEAMRQIPTYAKFLKDMCTFKRKSKDDKSKKVLLSEQLSSILKCDTPPKFKDPGVPTISCYIGNHKIERALLDLGSSVNLIPYSVYLELGSGELKPSNCTL